MKKTLQIFLTILLCTSITTVGYPAYASPVMPNLTQDVSYPDWVNDPNNGFTISANGSVNLAGDADYIWINGGEKGPASFTIRAAEKFAGGVFDLSQIVFDLYDAGSEYTAKVIGYKSNGSTVSTSVTGTRETDFNAIDLSSIKEITAFDMEFTLNTGDHNIAYLGLDSFTIAYPESYVGNKTPVVDNLNNITFQENIVNGDKQQITTDITVTDSDSPDFDSGEIRVSYTDSGLPEDQLSIGDIGNISLEGDAVNYSGIGQMGTMSGGINGTDLMISLNGNATPAGVQELLRALTYGNISNEPTSYRTISITVNDGDGASSSPVTAKIAVVGNGEAGPENPDLTQDVSYPDWVDDLNNGFAISANGSVTLTGNENYIWIEGGDNGPASFTITAAEHFEGGVFDLDGIVFDLYQEGSTYSAIVTGYKSDGSTVTTSVIGGTSEAEFNAIDLSLIKQITAFDIQFKLDSGSHNITYLGLESFAIAVSPNNSPVFHSAATFNVSETAKVDNTVLLDVQADDGDGGNNDENLTYSIIDGTGKDYFDINSVTGEIKLNALGEANLDYETDNSYILTIDASDGTTSSYQTVSVNINNVNEPPVIIIASPIIVSEDVTDQISGILFTDEDAGINNVAASFSVNSGTLLATSRDGVTIDGTSNTLTLTGTVTDINNYISNGNLSFITALNNVTDVTMNISIDDMGSTGPGGNQTCSDTAVITITAVNDAPVNMIPSSQTTEENTALILSIANGNAIQVDDVDSGSSDLNITLMASYGLLTLSRTDELDFNEGDGINDIVMKFVGTVNEINAALDGMSFTPDSNYGGTASILITVDDQGKTGLGGPLSDSNTLDIIVNKSSAPRPEPKQEPELELEKNDDGSVLITVPEPEVDEKTGKAKVELSFKDVENAFEQAETNEEGKKKIELAIPKTEGINSYEIELPKKALESDGEKEIEIITDIGLVTLPGNMLGDEESEESSNISLSFEKVEKEELSDETKERIGDRPVIEINLKKDGQVTSWENENTPVTISLPYTLKDNEDPEKIAVWYLDGEGNAIEVTNGKFDIESGMVVFNVTHFSTYAIAYIEKTFNDLDNYPWGKHQIEVLAAKGIINGIGNNCFSPGANITRADFLTMLVRTLQLNSILENNFDDVNETDYYYEAVGIAKALEITTGVGENKFNPKANISRQDMIVLVCRALRMKGLLDGERDNSNLDIYLDKSDITTYAQNSVSLLVEHGLITGSNNKINPKGNSTRVEAAVLLYRIYNYMF